MATLKPDWEKLATTLQGLGVPKSPPNPATTPVNFNIKPAPTTPTAQKGGMVDIPAGYNYSSTQGLYKDPSYGITNAQQNLMNELKPMTAEQSIARESDIQRQMQELWQPRIDAIAKVYEGRLGEARQRATAREAQQRAIQSSKGILTSEAGQAKVAQAEEIGKEDLQNIMNQQNLAMQEVYGKISDEARTRLEAERAEKLGFAEKSLELKNKLATQAMDNLKTLGASGIDLNKLKSNSEVYKSLQEGTGLSDLEMDAYLRSSQGDNIVKSGMEKVGNKLIGWTLDKNGQWNKTEFTTDLQPGEDYKEIDGIPYAMTTGADGRLQLRKLQGFEESADKSIDRQLKQMQIAKGYSEMAEKKAGAGTSQYSTEMAKRTIDSVDELSKDVNSFTVGLGELGKAIPGTPATDFGAKLNTLKANIAFNELKAMRDSSKTGGALGAISEKELALLESALGALDQRQSQKQFKEQLSKIKESVQRWQQAVGNTQTTGTTSSGVKWTIEQ